MYSNILTRPLKKLEKLKCLYNFLVDFVLISYYYFVLNEAELLRSFSYWCLIDVILLFYLKCVVLQGMCSDIEAYFFNSVIQIGPFGGLGSIPKLGNGLLSISTSYHKIFWKSGEYVTLTRP